MKNIVIFGAGKFARIAISLMKIDEIAYVVDNDKVNRELFSMIYQFSFMIPKRMNLKQESIS